MDSVALRRMMPANPFFIPHEQVAAMERALHVSEDQLLTALVEVAAPLARPDVSGWHVGEAAIGAHGDVYLGVNLEFPGQDPHETVHGEQFLVANAMRHGETKLVKAALPAPSCGHCRQFLYETDGGADLQLLWNGEHHTLKEVLPEPFGDAGTLLSPRDNHLSRLVDGGTTPLETAALGAANHAYIHNYPDAAGIALRMRDGTVYTGSYMEIRGQNPSLSPLQSALVAMTCDGRAYAEIADAVLVEQQGSPFTHVAITRSMLETLAPSAALTIRHAA